MPRTKAAFVVSVFFLLALTTKAIAQPSSELKQDDKLKSRAELTNYEETTRYEEVLAFIAELQKRSPLIRVESFGKSEEGRVLPLMILSTRQFQIRATRGFGQADCLYHGKHSRRRSRAGGDVAAHPVWRPEAATQQVDHFIRRFTTPTAEKISIITARPSMDQSPESVRENSKVTIQPRLHETRFSEARSSISQPMGSPSYS